MPKICLISQEMHEAKRSKLLEYDPRPRDSAGKFKKWINEVMDLLV